jgi:hypothetical protein
MGGGTYAVNLNTGRALAWVSDHAALAKKLAQAKARIAHLEAHTADLAALLGGEHARLVREIQDEVLTARIRELETENADIRDKSTQLLEQASARFTELSARYRELEARFIEAIEAEQAKTGANVEAEIAALRDENYAFRVELEARNRVFKNRAGGGLTTAQFRMLQQCCHPDNSASKETREKAIRLVNQLRYVLCNEAELPSMDPRKYSTWARQLWRQRQQEIKEVKKHARRRRTQPKASPKPPRNLPKG